MDFQTAFLMQDEDMIQSVIPLQRANHCHGAMREEKLMSDWLSLSRQEGGPSKLR